jgi:hypothetical protein
MLIHLYAVYTWEQDDKADAEAPHANGLSNGNANGYTRVDHRLVGADEFELEGLDSDDEDSNLAYGNKESRRFAAQQ